MQNQLFRKKSIERISSPEQLHDYMRVTSPRLWMLLSAILVLLAGFLIYASTATMENTLPIQVHVETEETGNENGTEKSTVVYAELPLSYKDIVSSGMDVRLADDRGKVAFIYSDDDSVGMMIQMEKENVNYRDGVYEGQLVVESTTPISFLWN